MQPLSLSNALLTDVRARGISDRSSTVNEGIADRAGAVRFHLGRAGRQSRRPVIPCWVLTNARQRVRFVRHESHQRCDRNGRAEVRPRAAVAQLVVTSGAIRVPGERRRRGPSPPWRFSGSRCRRAVNWHAQIRQRAPRTVALVLRGDQPGNVSEHDERFTHRTIEPAVA
jgi:hypothetical protein